MVTRKNPITLKDLIKLSKCYLKRTVKNGKTWVGSERRPFIQAGRFLGLKIKKLNPNIRTLSHNKEYFMVINFLHNSELSQHYIYINRGNVYNAFLYKPLVKLESNIKRLFKSIAGKKAEVWRIK